MNQHRRWILGCAALLAACAWAGTAGAITPEQKCRAARAKAAGKHAGCVQKSLAKYWLIEDVYANSAALGKCATKYAAVWPKVQPSCGDPADRFTESGLTVGDRLTGLEWQKKLACPAGDYAGTLAPGGLFTGPFTVHIDQWATAPETRWTGAAAGFSCSGIVADSTFSGSCLNGAASVSGTLNCSPPEHLHFDVTLAGAVVATGDTNRTPSVWDEDGAFTVSTDGVKGDGTAFNLPGPVRDCFASHCDWRLPSLTELLTILDPSACSGGPGPCIDPIFGPTPSGFYWSSTTFQNATNHAWYVHFYPGLVNPDSGLKDTGSYVRAVRGGF